MPYRGEMTGNPNDSKSVKSLSPHLAVDAGGPGSPSRFTPSRFTGFLKDCDMITVPDW